jgi:hypothetical protein
MTDLEYLKSKVKVLEDNAFSDRGRIGKLENEMEIMTNLWKVTVEYLLNSKKEEEKQDGSR